MLQCPKCKKWRKWFTSYNGLMVCDAGVYVDGCYQFEI